MITSNLLSSFISLCLKLILKYDKKFWKIYYFSYPRAYLINNQTTHKAFSYLISSCNSFLSGFCHKKTYYFHKVIYQRYPFEYICNSIYGIVTKVFMKRIRLSKNILIIYIVYYNIYFQFLCNDMSLNHKVLLLIIY